MRRGLVPPLFSEEVEPGEAIKLALAMTHPFTAPVDVPDALLHNIASLCKAPGAMIGHRRKQMLPWNQRALLTMASSLEELGREPDAFLRRLLRGCEDHESPELGQFFHVQLWREMAHAADVCDKALVEQIVQGMPIAGQILPSNRWPLLLENDLAATDGWTVSKLRDRA